MERLGINVMKRTVGYMAFRRALSINFLPRAILAFVYMCLLTGRYTWRCISFRHNQFSRGVQPIFCDICFSCSRPITIHQVIAIVLQFHFLLKFVSKRLFSFTVNWSDYILALTPNVSRSLSFVSVVFRSHIPTTKPIVNAPWLRPCKLHDDFGGIKFYCVRSCENECMYSWWVFNNEIIYYRHL